MTGATFVTCPDCGRFMLGQRSGGVIYPQPHNCQPTEGDSDE
jgi:hypothetical protein